MARNNGYQDQYRKNRREIDSRRQQPDRIPRGNYRLDQVNQSTSSHSSAIDERDYFDQGDYKSSASPRNRVYYFDEYTQQRQNLSHRMNQPQRRSPVENQAYPSRPSDQYIRRSRNQYINPSKRTNQSRDKSHPTNKLLRNSFSSLKTDLKGLPKGRAELAGAFLIIYIILFIASYNISPVHRINHIQVKGNEIVPSDLVASSSRIYQYDTYQNIMSQRKEISQLILDEIPMVEAVDFTRPSWQTFEINIKEHDFVGYTYQNNQVYPVLSNGEILNMNHSSIQMNIIQNTLPELIGFETSGQRLEIAKGLRQIDDSLLNRMERIYNTSEANKPNAIEVHMVDGNIIKAITSTFSQKVQYYDQLLQQIGNQTGLINLEVGAYFDSDTSSAISVKLDGN